MVSIKLSFSGTIDDSEEIVLDFLRSLKDNGQLIDFFQHPYLENGQLTFIAITHELDSISSKYFNIETKKHESFLKESAIEFTCVTAGSVESDFLVNYDFTSDLILHFGGASPIRDFNTFKSIPLYLLPPTSDDQTNYFNIITWERNFQSVYSLWYRGDFDEQYYSRQLHDPSSSLSLLGINLCKLITQKVGKKCYYHLLNDTDVDESRQINCPSCNHKWKMEVELFEMFKYKCDNCLLIS